MRGGSPSLDLFGGDTLPGGFRYQPDFLSREEESFLLQNLKGLPFKEFEFQRFKFITHWKRLSPKCENSIALMDARLRALAPKISVVLFQLPPNFSEDAQRLTSFLRMLPRCYRYAFEFRHKSWYVDRVLKILQEANVALCLSDHADAPAPWETTAQYVYVRGHGPSGRYHGTYPARRLRRWADAALRWQFEKRQVFIYFDNDQKAAAPKDARRLATMVGTASEII